MPDPGTARRRRVALLLAGIVVLSAADLLEALDHLRGPGLLEANPVAAFLIRDTGSAVVLSAYKALTVGICVGLLYRLRRRAAGEVGAWCAVAILAALSWHWYHYNRQVDLLAAQRPDAVVLGEPWLHLPAAR